MANETSKWRQSNKTKRKHLKYAKRDASYEAHDLNQNISESAILEIFVYDILLNLFFPNSRDKGVRTTRAHP